MKKNNHKIFRASKSSWRLRKNKLTVAVLFCLLQTACILTTLTFSFAQITFQKTFGGADFDYANCVQQTSDGGYIIAGTTRSFNANDEIYLIKTDANGDTLWTKTYGNVGAPGATSVQQTNDGGFIIGGHGEGDYHVLIRTDINGNILWAKAFGDGLGSGWGHSVLQAGDGGFVITGYIGSFGSWSDVSLLKTDANGNLQWFKLFDSDSTNTKYDDGYSVQKTNDDGYIIAGFADNASGGKDVYLIKTDTGGTLQWSKTFGGDTIEYVGKSVEQTTDGGYIIAGYTKDSVPNYNFLLLKTDAGGNLQWSKIFGGGVDWIYYSASVKQTNDGGYIIAGTTNSFGAGGNDVYIIRTDINGDALWAKTFGGVGNESGNSVQQTNDGGFVIAGVTYSFGAGKSDVYLIKTDDGGNSGCYDTTATASQNILSIAQGNPQTVVISYTVPFLPLTVTNPSTVVNTLCYAVGLNEIIKADLHIAIYPNPSNGTVQLDYVLEEGEQGYLVIYNILGKSEIRYPLDQEEKKLTISENKLNDGIYFYEVIINNNVEVKDKLLIVR